MDGRAGEGAAIREQVDMNVNTIRTITIKGEGQQSLDSLSSSLQKVATNTKTVASVTDITTKSTLSAEQAYKRQTLMVDAAARAQDQFARQARIADQALNQGKITAAEHATRIGVLQDRYSQAGKATQALTSAMGGLGKVFSAVSSAAATLGLALGVGAMVAYGKSVFNTTADLQEQADQILGAGGNVEALQALRGIFLTNGISQEQGDKILQKLTRSLGEAAEGSKKAQDAFNKLGLGSRELAGESAEAALPMVAEKLLKIEDASKRAAIETQIFGKTGQQLESALTALARPLSETIQNAKDLGLVIDEQMIQKADKAKDAMALSWQKLSVALAPIITEWVNGFTDFTNSINGSKSALEETIETAKNAGAMGVGAYAGFKLTPGPLPAKIGGAALGAAAGYMYSHQNQDTFANHLGDFDAGIPIQIPVPDQRYNLGYGLASARNGYVEEIVSSANRISNDNSWDMTKEQTSAQLRAAQQLEASRNHVKADEQAIAAYADTILKTQIKQMEVSIKDQQHKDQVAYSTQQYIEGLEKDVKLAAMSGDERERQLAVSEAMRISEGKLSDVQQEQIYNLTQQRQQAQMVGQTVEEIRGPCEELPPEFVGSRAVSAEISATLQEIMA